MPQTYVFVRTQFEAFHRWPDAPESVAFLRDFHRHLFKVELGVEVTHGDRQVEFFTLKTKLDDFIAINLSDRRFTMSCEQIAEMLQREFGCAYVTVEEDGENGATYHG